MLGTRITSFGLGFAVASGLSMYKLKEEIWSSHKILAEQVCSSPRHRPHSRPHSRPQPVPVPVPVLSLSLYLIFCVLSHLSRCAFASLLFPTRSLFSLMRALTDIYDSLLPPRTPLPHSPRPRRLVFPSWR